MGFVKLNPIAEAIGIPSDFNAFFTPLAGLFTCVEDAMMGPMSS